MYLNRLSDYLFTAARFAVSRQCSKYAQISCWSESTHYDQVEEYDTSCHDAEYSTSMCSWPIASALSADWIPKNCTTGSRFRLNSECYTVLKPPQPHATIAVCRRIKRASLRLCTRRPLESTATNKTLAQRQHAARRMPTD